MALSKQEVFTKAFIGAARQGFARAISSTTQTCAYRTSTGCSCLIGLNIPDELYDPRMDLYSLDVETLLEDFPRVAVHFEEVPTRFLGELQELHDRSDDPAQMQDALLDFAHTHQLEVPTL